MYCTNKCIGGYDTHREHTYAVTPTSCLVASLSCLPVSCLLPPPSLLHFFSSRGSDLESFCYWFLPKTQTCAFLFRATLTASSSLLKCSWFILEAIFYNRCRFLYADGEYIWMNHLFHISLNEPPLIPKASVFNTLPVARSQVAPHLPAAPCSLSLFLSFSSCLPPPLSVSALPFRQSS